VRSSYSKSKCCMAQAMTWIRARVLTSMSGALSTELSSGGDQDSSVDEKPDSRSIDHKFEPHCRRGVFSGMDL